MFSDRVKDEYARARAEPFFFRNTRYTTENRTSRTAIGCERNEHFVPLPTGCVLCRCHQYSLIVLYQENIENIWLISLQTFEFAKLCYENDLNPDIPVADAIGCIFRISLVRWTDSLPHFSITFIWTKERIREQHSASGATRQRASQIVYWTDLLKEGLSASASEPVSFSKH